MTMPSTVSESVRRLNPHLFGQGMAKAAKQREESAKKPIRQKRVLLNKTETDALGHLLELYPNAKIRAQSETLRLANGVRYTPDFTATFQTHPGYQYSKIAFEVKGTRKGKPHIEDDASVKLKVAAHEYPEITFNLMWKSEAGYWKFQQIDP